MKRFTFHLAAVLIAVAAFIAVTLLDARTSRGQSQSSVTTSDGGAANARVKPTASVRAKATEAAIESTTFGPAATRNGLLRSELNWTFGGKQQRGWQLYTALISRLISTEHDADSADFASALAGWQERVGLSPSGVLDQDSLYSMISQWQGARLKDRTYPLPDQLVTAATSDFYHPTRPDELRQVERETYAAYRRMVAAAAIDPSLGLARDADGQLAPAEKYLKIISAFRSREYQQQLRRQSPHVGRAGLAINSPHFTGRSLDLYVGGEPVETKDSNRAVQVQTPVYQWLISNAERFGFRPYFYEPWHWEYVK
ncbi:MAG: D-alanyl-D-alanine carboxypeptidase family protein [Pyrinomonadaceae bacterium]|nr:D-alanyl-D-alanine carboxypeptidase family protein [Pyrinomonadaceae bacterium]